MTLRNILIPAYRDYACLTQLDAALTIATNIDARIRVLFVQPAVERILSFLPEVIQAAGVTAEVVAREGREAVATARSEFDAWCKRHGVGVEPIDSRADGTLASWSE